MAGPVLHDRSGTRVFGISPLTLSRVWRGRQSILHVLLVFAALVVAVTDGAVAAAAPALAVALPSVCLSAALLVSGRPLFAIVAVPAVWAGERLEPLNDVVSISDAALVVGGFVPMLLLEWRRSALRGAMWSLSAFETLTLLAVVHAPSLAGAAEWAHRLFLVSFSLVIGAYLVQSGHLRTAVRLFLTVSTVLAVVAVATAVATRLGPAYPLGLHKNYAGSLLASAILVAYAVPTRYGLASVRRPLIVLLILGLIATQSHGAVIGLVVGLVVHTLMVRRFSTRQIVAMVMGVVMGVVLMTLVGLQFLPAPDTNSIVVSKFGPIATRVQFQQQALDIWQSSPVLGAGIRFFSTGHFTLQSDPHNVVVLTLAESGVVGLLALAVLLCGAGTTLRRHGGVLVPLAMALLVARFTHGLFDVYWVHGSQALPWIMVGAALAWRRESEGVAAATDAS